MLTTGLATLVCSCSPAARCAAQDRSPRRPPPAPRPQRSGSGRTRTARRRSTKSSANGPTKGLTVEVVQKDFGKIRDDLKTVQPESAPDVIIGAHDWTGQLAADGLVLPLDPTAATKAQFPAYALDAFSYGTAVKRLYGAPVALENIGLVVNTKLAKVPKTFERAPDGGARLQEEERRQPRLAVPQGAAGDAYHMYPFFSGLCGYVFGVNKAGNLDPSDIGVANATFLKNAPHDRQVEQGGPDQLEDRLRRRQGRVPEGQGRLLGHRPVGVRHARREQAQLQDRPGPDDQVATLVPFLGVQGFMVTKYASTPRRGERGEGPRRQLHDAAGPQARPRRGEQPLPGEHDRRQARHRPGPRSSSARASEGGVPMPNIPQMISVWADLGGAWVKSTKGAGATPAGSPSRPRRRTSRNKIG